MEEQDKVNFSRWLIKSNCTELDIIHCRKMQSMSITEAENTFGITTLSVCGFEHNDMLLLGGEIKQQYAETKEAYYNRVFGILLICAKLMDSVNEILADEGAWSTGYFEKRFSDWHSEKIASLSATLDK